MLARVLLVFAAFLVLAPAAGAARLICLDPGHARTPNLTTEPIGPGSSVRKIKDGGGTPGEATVVLQIARKLRSVLRDNGYRVAMTRTGPEFTLGAGGNVARARFCNRRNAALMLRIHADGSTDPSRHGAATLYPAWHRRWTAAVLPQSRRAAPAGQRERVASDAPGPTGLVRRRDLTGFNWANVPVILVETGVGPREAPLATVFRTSGRLLERLGDVGVDRGDHLVHQLVLSGEMVRDDAFADAGRLGDACQGGIGIPGLREGRDCRLDDLCSPSLLNERALLAALGSLAGPLVFWPHG
jgi:hypothetical protein